MKLSEFKGNERIVDYFKKAIATSHLGHAYLFSGPGGLGKRTLATLLCRTLLCAQPGPDGSCGVCAACHKFDSGNHADFHVYVPDGLYFKIDLVRQIIHDAALKPLESNWKTFVLESVDLMRDEPANALLRVLEEPPGQTILFLIAESVEVLLPTVRSRCQHFPFQPLRQEDIVACLVASGEVVRSEAENRARYSQGSLGRARIVNVEQYRELRDKVLSVFQAALTPRSYHVLLDAIKAITVDRTEMAERLLIAEELARDLIHIKASPEAAIIHQDARATLFTLADNADVRALENLYEQLLEAREAILKVNASIGLALQSVFLPLRLNTR
jgi:DNA polymerase-3 subunit delta'